MNILDFEIRLSFHIRVGNAAAFENNKNNFYFFVVMRINQDRLNSIIGPGQNSALGGPTYTTTHRNTNVNGR